jgi:hypothetical protein
MSSKFVHSVTVYFIWNEATCCLEKIGEDPSGKNQNNDHMFHLMNICEFQWTSEHTVRFMHAYAMTSVHFLKWSVGFHKVMILGEACNSLPNSSKVLTILCSSCSSHIGNSRALSFSAPSAINLEFSQVKFEEDTHDWTEESLLNKSTADHRWLLFNEMCMLFVMLCTEIWIGWGEWVQNKRLF